LLRQAEHCLCRRHCWRSLGGWTWTTSTGGYATKQPPPEINLLDLRV
jgi:hypothetical protein